MPRFALTPCASGGTCCCYAGSNAGCPIHTLPPREIARLNLADDRAGLMQPGVLSDAELLRVLPLIQFPESKAADDTVEAFQRDYRTAEGIG